MIGWDHRLNGYEFEQSLRVGDGQGGLACCSPRSHKELDMTEKLNWTELNSSEEYIKIECLNRSVNNDQKTIQIYSIYTSSSYKFSPHQENITFLREKQAMKMSQILEPTFWDVSTQSSFLSPSLRVDVHEFGKPSQLYSLTGVSSARNLVNSILFWCLLLWGPSNTPGLRNINIWTNALVMIPKIWWP